LNTLTGAATLGSGLNPMGTVIHGAWAVAPNGYLDCDGAAIDPQYTALIALVGANTPDMRGRFVRGWNTGQVDPDGARAPLTEQDEDFLAHTHALSIANGGSITAKASGGSGTIGSQNPAMAGGDETRPVNTALLYAIKW
jgi:microcystin-dependent protein